jgi:hypothetical protein
LFSWFIKHAYRNPWNVKGTREMNDFSTPYLALHKLMKSFLEATSRGKYDLAYQISLDITDVAHDLELIAKQLSETYGV